MGDSTSTHTHTCIKPVPGLVGMGTQGYGYGYSWVIWVWEPTWVCTMGLGGRRGGDCPWYEQVLVEMGDGC